jgi:hypothetical protein
MKQKTFRAGKRGKRPPVRNAAHVDRFRAKPLRPIMRIKDRVTDRADDRAWLTDW